MKLQRTPLILLILAALLGGIVFLNEQTATQKESTSEQEQSIFSFKEADVQTLTLKTADQSLTFAKTSQKAATTQSRSPTPSPTKSPTKLPASESTTWQMIAPQNAPANDASIAFLLNLLATAKREKSLTAPAAKQSDFGLDTPLATIDVTLNDQKQHRLVLGKPDFNRSALYALIDPSDLPKAAITVVLVPTDFENAVNRPLSEWQNPAPKAMAKPNPKTEKKSKETSK